MTKAADRSDWKDGFLFVGNELALDFVNTRPIQGGQPVELLKDFVTVLRWFHAAGLINSAQAANLRHQWGGTTIAQKATEAMKDLRERLWEDILAWEEGRLIRRSTLHELNGLLEAHPMLTRLTKNGSAPSTELWFEAHEPADLFAPLAHSVAALFATGDRGRVRKCDNCVLHFRDTSKKGMRRWCSMKLCGNRLKVATYAARHRESGA